jgi:hypothetical protein
MTTTRRVRPNRTTGLGHRLAAALILSALLAAFPVPAQAAAGADAARLIVPLAGLMSWLEGLLADLAFSPRASDELEAAFLPEGCAGEPLGGTCSQGLEESAPAIQDVKKGLSDRPATR